MDVADQRFVYDVQETTASNNDPEEIGAVISEYASEGWRFVETLTWNGTTVGLVFERRVDE